MKRVSIFAWKTSVIFSHCHHRHCHNQTVEKDDDWQQQITDVMEQFEKDTESIFRKFYKKCDQSGYRIEREKFMNLVTER